MENSNERVAQDAERGGDENQEKARISADEAVAKLRESYEDQKRYREKLSERGKQVEELQDQLKAFQEAAEKEKGNYKSLYEKAAEEKELLKAKLESTVKTYGSNVIQSKIRETLLEKKCSKPDAILKLFQGNLSDIPVDDSFNPDPNAVSDIVERGMSEFPEWFKSDTPKINDGTPVSKPAKAKGIGQMSKDEIMETLKQMK